jgi:hypothetical protein
VAKVGARLSSVRVVAARRERAAAREAMTLLRELVAPPGAHRISPPRNYGGLLRQFGPGPLGEEVAVHRFWSVPKPLKAVIAFLRAHRLQGFAHSSATWGSKKPHYLIMSSRDVAAGRFLDVTSVGLRTRTLVGVDVQIGWTYPRSPAERAPAETSEIVLRAPKAAARVTDPTKVSRIVRWFDALPISPPGIAVSCPLTVAPDITLSFRNARGVRLAKARVPSAFAWLCDPIQFSIGGRHQQPLIDSVHRESFVRRLQDLLGVHLVRAHH